jgi:hypothetical protein
VSSLPPVVSLLLCQRCRMSRCQMVEYDEFKLQTQVTRRLTLPARPSSNLRAACIDPLCGPYVGNASRPTLHFL